MDLLAPAFTHGWASGLNAYLVVLVLGVADRVGDLEQVPDVLGRWEVLAVAAVLLVVEVVVDKVPWLDSTWDAVSTAVRPTVGAVLGVLVAGDATSLDQAVGGVVGGGSALVSHLAKAGTRLALNTSPEPVTNIVASTVEDLAVLGVLLLAVAHPRAAAAVAGVLLVVALVVLAVVLRLVRRGWRRWRDRPPPGPPPGPPLGHPPGGAAPVRRPA